jgi:hypothetical protein
MLYFSSFSSSNCRSSRSATLATAVFRVSIARATWKPEKLPPLRTVPASRS